MAGATTCPASASASPAATPASTATSWPKGDRFDPLSGTAVLNGIPVTVRPAAPAPASRSDLESVSAHQ